MRVKGRQLPEATSDKDPSHDLAPHGDALRSRSPANKRACLLAPAQVCLVQPPWTSCLPPTQTFITSSCPSESPPCDATAERHR